MNFKTISLLYYISSLHVRTVLYYTMLVLYVFEYNICSVLKCHNFYFLITLVTNYCTLKYHMYNNTIYKRYTCICLFVLYSYIHK